jgi:hypothetical protein
MSDESLNAGWELDDELPAAPTEAESDPELQLDLEELREELSGRFDPPATTRHEDEKELLGLEARIEDLYYLASDLRQAGGMCQNFALEAERIIPGFSDVPIGYYTASPTATRFKVSMEKLSTGAWALIAAACAAIVAAIVRAIMWLSGKSSSSSSSSAPSYSSSSAPAKAQEQAVRKVQSQQQHAKVQLQSLETTQDVVRNIPVREIAKVMEKVEQENPAPTPAPRVSTINDLIYSLFTSKGTNQDRYRASLDFLEMKDPVFRDIATQGDYSRTMMVALARIDQINALLKDKVSAVKQIVHSDATKRSSQALVENQSMLDTVNRPMEITLTHGKVTLTEAVKQIGLLRETGGHDNGGDTIPFDLLCQAVTKAYKESKVQHAYQAMEASIRYMGELKDQLALLEKQLSNVTLDGLPGQNTEALAGTLRQVVFEIGKEVNAFTRFIYEVEHYIHYLNRASSEVMGIGSEVLRLLAIWHRNKSQPEPLAFSVALAELRKARDLSKAANSAIRK